MKSLFCGCAAFALAVGLAGAAAAQPHGSASAVADQPEASIEVAAAPIHAVPADPDRPDARGGPAEPMAPPEAGEQATAQAAQPALNDDERAFFAAVGHHIAGDAAAYDGYVRNTSALDSHPGGPAAVQQAVRTGADYQPRQMQEGMIAFAALLALRNQPFVDGVRAEADSGLAERLLRSPRAVLAVPGAQAAAADVAGALQARAARLSAKGDAITHAAYDMQHDAWSRMPAANPRGVLADVKAAGDQPRAADEVSEKALLNTLVATPRTPATADAAPSDVVVHSLALAALAVLGRTGDGADSDIERLLREPASAECLQTTRLQLDECLAAAGPNYEDAFCAGRHAVGETAGCISHAAAGAGGAYPTEIARADIEPPAPAHGADRVEQYRPESNYDADPAYSDQSRDAGPPQETARDDRYASAQPRSYEADEAQAYGPEEARAYGYRTPRDGPYDDAQPPAYGDAAPSGYGNGDQAPYEDAPPR